MMKSEVAAAIGGALLVLVAAAPSHAYVRSTTENNTPVFWPGACAWIFPDKGGTPDLPLDTVVATLKRSIANWQSITTDAGCSYLRISQDAAAEGEAHFDYQNVLKFDTTGAFCRPAEQNNPEVCYPAKAAAITTVFYTNHPGKPDDGAILDADIQMNDVNFFFVVVDANGKWPEAPAGRQAADLENTLTHELGHFQGLDHTCWGKDPPHETTAPLDNTGAPVASCADVVARKVPLKDYLRITESTMFPTASEGETMKRSPTDDDTLAICEIYPAAKKPDSCERPQPPSSGGCMVAARHDPVPWRRTPLALGLLGVVTLGMLARRRRQRR